MEARVAHLADLQGARLQPAGCNFNQTCKSQTKQDFKGVLSYSTSVLLLRYSCRFSLGLPEDFRGLVKVICILPPSILENPNHAKVVESAALRLNC